MAARPPDDLKAPPRRRRLAVGIPLAIAVGASLFLVLRAPPPEPALPSPNGYEDLIRAASLVDEATIEPFRYNETAADSEALRAALQANESALMAMRAGLRKQSAALEISGRATAEQKEERRRATRGFKTLFRLLYAESELARRDDDVSAALDVLLSAYAFAEASTCRGVVFGPMWETFYKGQTLDRLKALTPRLTARQCETALRAVRPPGVQDENLPKRASSRFWRHASASEGLFARPRYFVTQLNRAIARRSLRPLKSIHSIYEKDLDRFQQRWLRPTRALLKAQRQQALDESAFPADAARRAPAPENRHALDSPPKIE